MTRGTSWRQTQQQGVGGSNASNVCLSHVPGWLGGFDCCDATVVPLFILLHGVGEGDLGCWCVCEPCGLAECLRAADSRRLKSSLSSRHERRAARLWLMMRFCIIFCQIFPLDLSPSLPAMLPRGWTRDTRGQTSDNPPPPRSLQGRPPSHLPG